MISDLSQVYTDLVNDTNWLAKRLSGSSLPPPGNEEGYLMEQREIILLAHGKTPMKHIIKEYLIQKNWCTSRCHFFESRPSDEDPKLCCIIGCNRSSTFSSNVKSIIPTSRSCSWIGPLCIADGRVCRGSRVWHMVELGEHLPSQADAAELRWHCLCQCECIAQWFWCIFSSSSDNCHAWNCEHPWSAYIRQLAGWSKTAIAWELPSTAWKIMESIPEEYPPSWSSTTCLLDMAVWLHVDQQGKSWPGRQVHKSLATLLKSMLPAAIPVCFDYICKILAFGTSKSFQCWISSARINKKWRQCLSQLLEVDLDVAKTWLIRLFYGGKPSNDIPWLWKLSAEIQIAAAKIFLDDASSIPWHNLYQDRRNPNSTSVVCAPFSHLRRLSCWNMCACMLVLICRSSLRKPLHGHLPSWSLCYLRNSHGNEIRAWHARQFLSSSSSCSWRHCSLVRQDSIKLRKLLAHALASIQDDLHLQALNEECSSDPAAGLRARDFNQSNMFASQRDDAPHGDVPNVYSTLHHFLCHEQFANGSGHWWAASLKGTEDVVSGHSWFHGWEVPLAGSFWYMVKVMLRCYKAYLLRLGERFGFSRHQTWRCIWAEWRCAEEAINQTTSSISTSIICFGRDQKSVMSPHALLHLSWSPCTTSIPLRPKCTIYLVWRRSSTYGKGVPERLAELTTITITSLPVVKKRTSLSQSSWTTSSFLQPLVSARALCNFMILYDFRKILEYQSHSV